MENVLRQPRLLSPQCRRCGEECERSSRCFREQVRPSWPQWQNCAGEWRSLSELHIQAALLVRERLHNWRRLSPWDSPGGLVQSSASGADIIPDTRIASRGEDYEGKEAKLRLNVERDLSGKTFPADLVRFLKD